MRSHRFHHPLFGMGWSPFQLVLALLVALLFLIFLFIFLTITARPAQGQTSVPPTAMQAAKLPQFASKLSHAVKLSPQETASRLHRTEPHASYKDRLHISPFDSNDTYDNGPINGTTDAWTINFGYAVADSFNLPNSGNLSGMSFGAWLEPGDTLQTVEISITNAPFGGTSYFDQVVTVTQSGCVSNQYGFNVCTVSATWPDAAFNSGAYWVNLQNAVDNEGNPVYWDENSGVDCTGSGCPSSASENSIGTIPSESFTLLGEGTTSSYSDNYACPPPTTGWQELHEVDSASSGIALDTTGNLYGAAGGGTYDAGLLYRIAQKAGHWFYNTLYSLLGGNDGATPSNLLVGPDGALYGTASGGLETCGSDGTQFCGIIYKVNLGSVPCASALCSWDENTLYEFAGNSDAWGGTVAGFDTAGNLYGFSGSGGAYGHGAVFELSSVQGGWSEKIVYSFSGRIDGSAPTSLLVGHDGNLYGTTAGGGLTGAGVVFRIARSASVWTERILYSFTGTTDGFSPGGLIQDSAGTLYGFSTCYNGAYTSDCGGGYEYDYYGFLFLLRPIGNVWSFSLLYSNLFDCNQYRNVYHALAIDPGGTLYAAEGGADLFCSLYGCYTNYCGMITSWNGSQLVAGNADIFTNLTLDSNGNLYGATLTCGGLGTPFRTDGMVWKYSQQAK